VGSSVGYAYDQRGLLPSITCPDDKIVTYTRDALGRIDSVTYDGTLLANSYYLGDTVISKTLAHIKYTAAVDTLGRVTGETFTAISTGTPFMTHSYDYTGHSNRLDERNGIDYTFDGLGKLTAEDSTSYTSDILGNPTNAVDDGLTYGLDGEDRIVDVDDGGGVFAEYGYDRLGRRAKKAVDGIDTNFVYDLFGNVIAEYEDGSWSRDYIYGAVGEVVYMRSPQTSEMNDALANFIDFAEAWLCYPYCTQDELLWDVNADDQINLIDWAAADANDLSGAFLTNGYYLLTDFRNSVIGKVNPDGGVDEIFYDAWGTPYVSQGVDLEGLSILWNGYYYDYETGNYYLRNRYYSPLERRFLTEDPHGINPDENWNNPFGIQRQYADGYALQVYAKGDPVNNRDDWGLTTIIEYRNPGLTGHAGLLVDGRDYDFGPLSGSTGPGQSPWQGSRVNMTTDATTYALKLKKRGYMLAGPKKGIPCCKLKMRNAGICVKYVAVEWDGTEYHWLMRSCRNFVKDAKYKCCLIRK